MKAKKDYSIFYKTYESICHDLEKMNTKDDNFKAILEVMKFKVESLAKEVPVFYVGSTTFRSHLVFILNRLNSISNSLDSRTLSRVKAAKAFKDTVKAANTLKGLFDGKVEDDKKLRAQVLESMGESKEEPEVEESEDTKPIEVQSEQVELPKKPSRFMSFLDLKAIKAKEPEKASVQPMRSNAPKRPGSVVFDQKFLLEEKEQESENKALDVKINNLIGDQLKKFTQYKSSIPKLAEGSKYKVFKAPIFTPGFIPDNVAEKLSFNSVKVEGGYILEDQSVIMVDADSDTKVKDVIKALSSRVGINYADVLDGSHVVTTFNKSVFFVWIMRGSDLAKVSRFISTAKFPWDADTKHAKLANKTAEQLRKDIEARVLSEFKTRLKKVEENKTKIANLEDQITTLLDSAKVLSLQERDFLKKSSDKEYKAMKAQIKSKTEAADKLAEEVSLLKKENRETKREYESALASEKEKALKALKK